MSGFALPLDCSTGDEKMLCINTHFVNALYATVKNALPVSIVAGLLLGPLGFLSVLIANAVFFSGQVFARDFIIIKKVNGHWNITENNKNLLSAEFIFGKQVYSVGTGVVTNVVNNLKDNVKTNELFGNYVVIKHDSFLYSTYAHLSEGSITVKVGDVVKRKTQIGRVGSTGSSYVAHLHFQLTKTNPININFLGSVAVPNKVNLFSTFSCLEFKDLKFLSDDKPWQEPISKINELPHIGILLN